MDCNNDPEIGLGTPYNLQKQKTSEGNDSQGDLNLNSKRMSIKQLKTVSSAHSFDGDNNIPTITASDSTSHKKQFSLPQQYRFSDFASKVSSGKSKQSLSENLNEKCSTLQLGASQSFRKITFRISWTPINQFLCCCFLGHVGISNSNGIVYDFKNNFFIGADEGDNELRLFGKPTKDLYLELDSEEQAQRLHEILRSKQLIYTSKEAVVGQYKLLRNNCHHFVADVLNTFRYKDKSDYTALWVWRKTLIHAKYRNCKGFLKTWASPLIILFFLLIFTIIYIVDYYCHFNIFS